MLRPYYTYAYWWFFLVTGISPTLFSWGSGTSPLIERIKRRTTDAVRVVQDVSPLIFSEGGTRGLLRFWCRLWFGSDSASTINQFEYVHGLVSLHTGRYFFKPVTSWLSPFWYVFYRLTGWYASSLAVVRADARIPVYNDSCLSDGSVDLSMASVFLYDFFVSAFWSSVERSGSVPLASGIFFPERYRVDEEGRRSTIDLRRVPFGTRGAKCPGERIATAAIASLGALYSRDWSCEVERLDDPYRPVVVSVRDIPLPRE